jgi:hypothetical protein
VGSVRIVVNLFNFWPFFKKLALSNYPWLAILIDEFWGWDVFVCDSSGTGE